MMAINDFFGKKVKYWSLLIISLILIIIIVGVYMAANDSGSEQSNNEKKVLVLGIDGMDPRLAEQMMRDGSLPNFEKLAEQGSFMPLNTSFPPHSPVAWTSIATGNNPGKHNIFDFIRRNVRNYMPELSLSKTVSGIAGTDYESYVDSDPFWRLTTNNGLATNIIRWPMTFPPERIEGNMLSGLGVPDIKGFLSGYAYYTSNKSSGSEKDTNKVVIVDVDGSEINTRVAGPVVRKPSGLEDVTTPMNIELEESRARIKVSGQEYTVGLNEWSDWIRAEFKTGVFKKTSGIFKAYLKSLEPFEMYITTVQIDPEKPVVDISYPEDYSKKLAEKIGLYYTLGIPEETDGMIDGHLGEEAFLSHTAEIESERTKMFWEEFETFQKEGGVFGFVFDTSDRIQHMFWDEKNVYSQKNASSEVVKDYYKEKDELIGEIMRELDNNTLLLVISDHGFTSFERAVSLNTWLVENGYMSLTKDLEDVDEGSLFQYVDWSRTKAYALGFNSLYINTKGRETKGVVKDREAMVEEIVEKLENFTDPATGEKVVNEAYKREDIYHGDNLEEAPDIVIGFNKGYRMAWETAIGGFNQEVLYDNEKKWVADHLVDPKFVPGVLFSNKKLGSEQASQMDVVPTVLSFLDLEYEDLDGKNLLS